MGSPVDNTQKTEPWIRWAGGMNPAPNNHSLTVRLAQHQKVRFQQHLNRRNVAKFRPMSLNREGSLSCYTI